MPTQAEAEAGVVWCRAYRRDPGETEFQQVDPAGLDEYDAAISAVSNNAGIQAASYSSAWAVTSWAGGYEERALIRDNARSQERRSIRGPDAFNIGVPKGPAMAQAGSRFAVGSGDVVYMSEAQNPFRHSEFARPESDVYAQTRSYAVGLPDSGVAALIPADATGTLAAVYALTGRMTLLVQGTQAQLIAERGAVGPYDAVIAEGTLFLHDARKEALAIAGRAVQSLSSRLVEDDFTAGNAGRIRGSVGTLGTRVFYSVKVGDAVGERVMVYDTQLQAWESRVVLPSNKGARFFQPINRNGQKLGAWLADGSLVLYGEGSTDTGTAISFLVETPDLIGSPRLAARRMAVDGDSASGSLTITTARIPVSETGSEKTGTIAVAATGRTQATENASPPPGLAGRVMRLKISGSLPAGWRLYRWMCDLNQRPEGWPKQ